MSLFPGSFPCRLSEDHADCSGIPSPGSLSDTTGIGCSFRSRGGHVVGVPDSSISPPSAGKADWVFIHWARFTEIDPDSSFGDSRILHFPQISYLGSSGNAKMNAFSYLPFSFLSFRNGICVVEAGVLACGEEREDLLRDTLTDRALRVNRAGALTVSPWTRFKTVFIQGSLLSAAGSANIGLHRLLVLRR